MDIEDVDPVGLQFLEGVPEGDVQRALVVAAGVDGSETLAFPVAYVVLKCVSEELQLVLETRILTRSELSSNNHFITVTSLLHPLANPGLRLIILIVVGPDR